MFDSTFRKFIKTKIFIKHIYKDVIFINNVIYCMFVTDPTKKKKNVVKKFTRRVLITREEKELKKKLVAARIKLSKCRNKVKEQALHIKAASNVAKNPKFLKVMENLSSTAKILIHSQFREVSKKKQGRRFTMEEKVPALLIMKQSPKCYRLLRKIFILPAPQTLTKLLQKCFIQPGINKNIFSQLQKRCENMTKEEKMCVILFDEISIKPNLTYNERRDKVVGFVTNGQETVPEIADHAQVFMVRGVLKNYKQPLAYSFSQGATKGAELCKQLKKVITEVQKAGLIVVATVCDQGANNRHAIKLLLQETRGVLLRRGETPRGNIIIINDSEIVPLYDPPHLLKGVRNNLITKNLKYVYENEQRTAKWAHLQLLLKENPGYKGIRLIPKLTESHVVPEKISKMKVKFASQVFSRTVASNMGYLAGN